MQAGTQAAEAESKALRAEANRLRDEATRLREERQAKEKELADSRLELATIRRTSDVATESLKSGIFILSLLFSFLQLSLLFFSVFFLSLCCSLIMLRIGVPQSREIGTGAGSTSTQELQINPRG